MRTDSYLIDAMRSVRIDGHRRGGITGKIIDIYHSYSAPGEEVCVCVGGGGAIGNINSFKKSLFSLILLTVSVAFREIWSQHRVRLVR